MYLYSSTIFVSKYGTWKNEYSPALNELHVSTPYEFLAKPNIEVMPPKYKSHVTPNQVMSPQTKSCYPELSHIVPN